MISSSTFYQLTFSQQADLLSQEGLFLHTRLQGNFIVDLFELDELLVEVFYNKESEELVSVLAFSSVDNLRSLTNGTDLRPRMVFRQSNALDKRQEYAA